MAPTKQYVNLPAKESQKTWGNKPVIEATPTKKKGVFQSKRKVSWTVESTNGTKNVDQKYLAAASRAKVKDAESKEADGKFTTELTLPYVGKDKWKVVCKKVAKKVSDRTQLKEIEFETWRKIYYTVWVMNDECDRIFTAVKARFHAAFEPAGVELEMVGKFRCKVDEAWTKKGTSVADFDLPWVYPDDKVDLEHPPFHMKVVLLNDIRSLSENAICSTVDKKKKGSTWEAKATYWVVDLDEGSRPASKGTVKVEAINAPSKLTQEQVDKIKNAAAGDQAGVSDAGKLTKGNLDVTAGKTVVFDGAGWKLLGTDTKKVADVEKLAPAKGTIVKLSDGGKLTKGTLDVVANDQVIFDGTKWVKVKASIGTFKVKELNDPKPKPAGPTDPQLDSLAAPANNDAWELEDDGKLTAGNVDVKKGHLVKWDGSKWVIHRGRWEFHLKPGHPFAPGTDWNKQEILFQLSGGSVGNIAPDKMEKVGDEEVKIAVHTQAAPNDELDRGLEIKVQPKLGLYGSAVCGYSCGNFVVVRIKENKASDALLQTCVLQTFTHEIGHGLQQTKKELQLYNTAGSATTKEKNDNWHTDDKGGRGDHCWHNGKEVDSTTTSSKKTFEWDSTKGKLCTMFFRDDDNVDPDGKFCPGCSENLRRTPLDKAAMEAKFWNTFK